MSQPGPARSRVRMRVVRSGVVGLALTGLLLPIAALASPVPSQDERDAAAAAVTGGEDRVAELEGQLAASDAELADAEVAQQLAAEEYLLAQSEAETARTDAATAQQEAADAQATLELALDDLAAIALDAYRRGGTATSQAAIFLSADGLDEALRMSAAYSMATGAAGDAAARADEAQAASDVAADRAETAQTVLADREARAAEAKTEADDAVAEVLTAQEALAALMDSAVIELAALRNTSAELERAYQESLLEAQRAAAGPTTAQAGSAQTPATGAGESSGTGTAPSGGDTTAGGPPGGGSTNPAAAATTPAPAATTPAPAPAQTTPAPAQTTPAPAATTPAPAPSTPAPVTPTPVTPVPTNRLGQQAVDLALTQVGKPYVTGGTGPNNYDCSGLVQWTYKQLGVSLPRTTRQQWAATTRVTAAQLQPGDLIFYSDNGQASGIYHVAIYTGPGMRVHAPSPGKNVEHVKIWLTNVIGYGRVS